MTKAASTGRKKKTAMIANAGPANSQPATDGFTSRLFLPALCRERVPLFTKVLKGG
jgi:hypothetical protein